VTAAVDFLDAATDLTLIQDPLGHFILAFLARSWFEHDSKRFFCNDELKPAFDGDATMDGRMLRDRRRGSRHAGKQ